MNTKTECPVCHGDVSLWDGMRAPTPFRIRCPHCRTRLQVKMRGLRWVFALMVLVGIGVGVWLAELWFRSRRLLILGVACVVVAWLIAELVAGVVLYTYARFDPVGKDPAA
jgi:hypothetical protein